MLVFWEEFGFKSLFDLQLQQMILYSTLLIMNKAYKLLVLVPNLAPHKYKSLVKKGEKNFDRLTPKLKKSDLNNICYFACVKIIATSPCDSGYIPMRCLSNHKHA